MRRSTSRKFGRKFTAMVLAPVLILGLSSFGLASLGIPMFGIHLGDGDNPTSTEATTAKKTSLQHRITPAYAAIARVFGSLDNGWDRQGRRVDSAGLPHPLSCVKPAPAISVSQLYAVKKSGKIRSGAAQVTITGYGAGVGADAFKRIVDKAAGCKRSNVSLTSTAADIGGPAGVQSHRFRAIWSGNDASTVMWRRGDIVAMVTVSTSGKANLGALVHTIDAELATQMTGVCVNEKSYPQDALRNVVAGKKFTGLLQKKPLETARVTEPELSAEQDAQGVVKVKVPSSPINVRTVYAPAKPTDYPVSPEMPAAMSAPVLPTAPKPQNLKSLVEVRLDDPEGPGCGWDFLATAAAPFNPAQVEAANLKLIASAQHDLDADGARWTKQTIAYWGDYADYKANTAKYRTYAEQVDSVTVAWNRIRTQWGSYYTNYANWEIRDKARSRLIADRNQARIDYRNDVKECETQKAALDAETDPVKKADLQQAYDSKCPAARPAAMDAKIPAVEAQPSKPANPQS